MTVSGTFSGKTFLKSALCGAYQWCGAGPLVEGLTHLAGFSRSAILLFHRVTDEIPEDGLTVGTARFRKICRMLRRGFRVVPLGEVFHTARCGGALPRRTVAITFDDCYYDNLAAARVLAEHGLPACFFVPAGYVGTDHTFPWDRRLKPLKNLSWDDVRAIAGLGFEIGSHTLTHPDLGTLPLDQARVEIIESRKVIEARVGRPVRWFAYPFGAREHFRDELLAVVEEAGYEGCVSGDHGFVHAGMRGPMLPREPAPPFDSVRNLELYLAGSLRWFYGLKRRALSMTRRRACPGSPDGRDNLSHSLLSTH